AEFFRRPATPYVLVASLSIAEFPAKASGWAAAQFPQWAGEADSRFRASLMHLGTNPSRLIHAQPVTTLSRSPQVDEATDRAITALNLLRGLWSISATFGSWTLFSSPARRPIGVFHTGPVFTLHRPDGALAADDLYWVDPDYSGDHGLFRNPE